MKSVLLHFLWLVSLDLLYHRFERQSQCVSKTAGEVGNESGIVQRGHTGHPCRSWRGPPAIVQHLHDCRPLRLLTDEEKDALLERQAALIEALLARIEALEAAQAKPRKTSRNSHTPPSQDPGGGRSGGGKVKDKPKKPRPSRLGVSRRLATNPDETIVCRAERCACGADVSGREQTCRMRYDHVDIPPVTPHVTRVELHGGRCACGKRYRAVPPAGMPPGTPFGPNIHALLAYLHHSHHVGFERLARLAREMVGLSISEGAIANGVRPCAWTDSGGVFDLLAGVVVLELAGAQVSQR
jgi:transposase